VLLNDTAFCHEALKCWDFRFSGVIVESSVAILRRRVDTRPAEGVESRPISIVLQTSSDATRDFALSATVRPRLRTFRPGELHGTGPSNAAALPVTIVPAAPDHVAALAGFFTDNDRPEITTFFHPFPLTTETAQRITQEARKDRYYVALEGPRVVGLAMLRAWDEGYDVPSFGLIVDYRFQGSGLGRRLTEFAIGQARLLDCRAVRLTVWAANAHAARLYESLGFIEVERRPMLRSGEHDMRLTMSLTLDGE